MVHLLFLVANLGFAVVCQFLLLATLKYIKSCKLRRSLELLGLGLPLFTLVLFSLMMLPVLFNSQIQHHADEAAHQEWTVGLLSFSLVALPVIIAFLLQVGKAWWLYHRTYRHSWEGPAHLARLARLNDTATTATSGSELRVRLWHSPRAFAYNLPGIPLGAKPLVVLSTAMLEKLDQSQLEAVLQHEAAHLAHRDFWVRWLANWWRTAFFYLPVGHRLAGMLHAEQELACDNRVVRQGGNLVALALAEALLKVWEEALEWATSKKTLKREEKTIFEAPGLAWATKSGLNLTEQRVNRLIELAQTTTDDWNSLETTSRLKTGGIVGGSLSLWLVGQEILHLIIMPLGCAVTLGLM